MTIDNVKFSKRIPEATKQKALDVILEHKAKNLHFQKAKNGLYWHYTLPGYYKVVHHQVGDYYKVLSAQEYAKYQKTHC